MAVKGLVKSVIERKTTHKGDCELLELVAKGVETQQRWRCALPPGGPYILGRDVECDFPAPWDRYVSRAHVQITLEESVIRITKHPQARNGIFVDGNPVEECELSLGDTFVVGETRFQIAESSVAIASSPIRPIEEMTFDSQELRKVQFRDADTRIEVLSHLADVIWQARSDIEFHHRLVNLILAGVTHADAAAIVEVDDNGEVQVVHWERRNEMAGEIRPSARLVVDSVQERRRSILQVWESSETSDDDYTAVAEFDWAFCTPLPEPCKDKWGLYVAGRLDQQVLASGQRVADDLQLQADVKFTEIVAEIIAAVRRANELERRQAGYRQFFAPPILAALGDNPDAELLEPRECDITVMFCDLRGFSRKSEESADDLLDLLDRVSRALAVMTRSIHSHGGVTADLQGDSALGFWGWPLASDEAPLNACRAALAIREAFAETRNQPDHPLADFHMGIGIAHGRAVAGKIGASEPVKITVFGPVVNLASRLESMTKQLRVPIVLDEKTAQIARVRLDPNEGRVRTLAKVLPYGMKNSVVVEELLPPAHQTPELTDDLLEAYEQGVAHFIAGRWEEAYHCLHGMPADDRAQDFLMMLIAEHNRVAPPGWDGIARLSAK